MPGTVTPWKRTGENSITRPVQLISQPTTPVKTGMERTCHQSTCWKNQSISSSISHRPLASAVQWTVADTNGWAAAGH